jgi:hypothetical protein
MTCLHCNTLNPDHRPFTRPIEGGSAYARVCMACGRILSLRPRLPSDPPFVPPALTPQDVERLQFLKWRLSLECATKTRLHAMVDAEICLDMAA